jgi:osmotically-inducible protein OsmY
MNPRETLTTLAGAALLTPVLLAGGADDQARVGDDAILDAGERELVAAKAVHRKDVSDAEIRQAVVDVMKYDPRVISFHQDVAVVNGVTDIENLLDVESTVPAWSCSHSAWDPVIHDLDFDYQAVRVKPDREIRDDIGSELRWSPFVDREDIDVAVEDGTATLTGQVDSCHERSLATDNAIEGGAVKVLNKLRVSAFGGSS